MYFIGMKLIWNNLITMSNHLHRKKTMVGSHLYVESKMVEYLEAELESGYQEWGDGGNEVGEMGRWV